MRIMRRRILLFDREAIVRDVCIAILFLISGKFGLEVTSLYSGAGPVWAPAGIALASFLLFGYQVWPGVLVGAFIVNVGSVADIWASLGIALSNMLGGMVGAYMVGRYANGKEVFNQGASIINFAIVGAMLSAMVSATLGVVSLTLFRFSSWSNFGSLWMSWWLGDAVGDVVVAPFIVLWWTTRPWWLNARQVGEGALALLILILLGQIVFGNWFGFDTRNYPIEILNIPVIIWAALRFNQREIATGSFVLSLIAIYGSLHGHGPFARYSANAPLLLVEIFIGITAVMALAAGAVVSERRKLTVDLQHALASVKTLNGLLPICAWCKKIRNDTGYWEEVESYIRDHSELSFSHGICPDCLIRYKAEVINRRRERSRG